MDGTVMESAYQSMRSFCMVDGYKGELVLLASFTQLT
jgi:hypothetical protein